VLLHKPKTLCTKLSGACQVYCCFKLACDVTDFEAYTQRHRKNRTVQRVVQRIQTHPLNIHFLTLPTTFAAPCKHDIHQQQ
jgi:hypothetical protein